MITIYTDSNSTPCRKAIDWFKENDIHVIERKISKRNILTRSEIIKFLRLSQNGFEDLLSIRSNKAKILLDEINSCTVTHAVELIIKYPELLKKPLIIDDNKIVAGFSTELIRCFVPEKRRIQSLNNYYLSERNSVIKYMKQ